jgi:hypothetical protein
MWSFQSEGLPGKRGIRFAVDFDAHPASFADILRAWQHDAQLADAPYSAFRWETPPVTDATLTRPFEFVLLDSPGLARHPDPRAQRYAVGPIAPARRSPANRGRRRRRSRGSTHTEAACDHAKSLRSPDRTCPWRQRPAGPLGPAASPRTGSPESSTGHGRLDCCAKWHPGWIGRSRKVDPWERCATAGRPCCRATCCSYSWCCCTDFAASRRRIECQFGGRTAANPRPADHYAKAGGGTWV